MTYTWTAPAVFADTTVYDEDDLNAQIRDNIGYLYEQLPARAMALISSFSLSGAIISSVATSQPYNMVGTQYGTPADGDSFTHPFVLSAGTYTMTVLGVTSSNYGKLDWTLGGISIATGQDWYSAVATWNVTKTVSGIVVPRGGRYSLAATVNGKNTSSSNYYIGLTAISLAQASD